MTRCEKLNFQTIKTQKLMTNKLVNKFGISPKFAYFKFQPNCNLNANTSANHSIKFKIHILMGHFL